MSTSVSSCRFVLLASSLGRNLARAAHESAPFLFPASHVAKPLLKCGGKPLLQLWLEQLRTSPRLAAEKDSIIIVVNDTHYESYKAWAQQEGFPVENLINNGSKDSDGTRPGDVADFALAVSKVGSGHFYFVARADCCFEPGQLLRHFLESAILTGRPTVVAVRGRAASYMGGLPLELTTDSLPQSCHMGRALEQANNTFKVNTSAIEQGRGDEWKSVPCYGFPAGLAEQVTAQYSSPNQGPQKCSLDELFAVYNRSNPITAWTCPVYFTVSTVWNLLLTDYFFQHVEKRRAHIKQEKAKVQPRSRACVGAQTLLGCDRPPVDLIANAESAALSLDLEQELNHFHLDLKAALVTRSQVEEKDMTLPKRFIQAKDWRYNLRRKQHPCYTTSSQDIGYRNPKQSDMPMLWKGAKGEFTKAFAGPPRDRGLRCFTEMSKVHKRLDEYTHFR